MTRAMTRTTGLAAVCLMAACSGKDGKSDDSGPTTFVSPCSSLTATANELIKECLRLGIGEPDAADSELIRDEIAICFLAFFHRRRIKLNYQLEMEVVASCPGGRVVSSASAPVSVMDDCLQLVGILPLGGRSVFFYSSLAVHHWTAMDAGAVEHNDSLCAVRDGDGGLRLDGDELKD